MDDFTCQLEASWALSRALLERECNLAVREGSSTFATALTDGASEDEIMAEAVRMTRRL